MGINDPSYPFTQWAAGQQMNQERIQHQRDLYGQSLQGSQLLNNAQAGCWNQGDLLQPFTFTQADMVDAMFRAHGQTPPDDPNVIDLPADAVRVVEDVPLIENKPKGD